MVKYIGNIEKNKFAPLVLVVFFIVLSISFVGCHASKTFSVDYLGGYTVPANLDTLNTVFSGISGLDYDTEKDLFYLISDDRSEYAPARMYEAKFQLSNKGIEALTLSNVKFLSDINGEPFAQETCDFESVRYHPKKQQWILGNEGGKKGSAGIYYIDKTGKIIDSLPIENHIREGLRFNKTFEGISLSSETNTLFYTTEAPLVSDGKAPTLSHGGMVRIAASTLTGNKIMEWFYELEKVPKKATEIPPWGGTGSDNGLAELLYLEKDWFLTLERAGAYKGNGIFDYSCKVFFTKLKNEKTKSRTLAKKKLLIDFNEIPNGNFNVEGMSFGPKINGIQTLLFVSDNNFKSNIPTQFYLFGINEKSNGKS